MEVELLKGCKHCGTKPKLSSMKSDIGISYSFICCRIGYKSKSQTEAAYYWNESNINSDKTYRKNNKTNQWELINNDSKT
jgi:hypothetical protein